jgi:hypothetical protein
MSVTQTPVVATAAPVAAPKLNAIQIVEKELENFTQQHLQAVSNVHALEGAIQAARHLMAKLSAAAAEAEAEIKKGIALVEQSL